MGCWTMKNLSWTTTSPSQAEGPRGAHPPALLPDLSSKPKHQGPALPAQACHPAISAPNQAETEKTGSVPSSEGL